MMTTNRDSIFPYVVPSSWVAHTGLESLISWEISSDVFVVLVFDGEGAVRNVRPEDLSVLDLDEGEAFQVAAHNLDKAWHAGGIDLGSATLLDGTQVGCARGSWMAPAAALILGDFHAALSEEFGTSEFVAVAVNQECLFAFPIDDHTLASESLRIALDDEFNGHRKPISRQWLYLNGEWPQPYSGAQLF
ncbi:hypothetical protein [Duganella sp. BuS-21]|uniref:hypothetical protein n=1 Tax=Duganella sp. BuS-21 TaxID=2943848 RepID=UPI0035A595F5